jgi:hypothetical protein
MKAKKTKAKYKTKVMVAQSNYRIKEDANRSGNTDVVQTAPVATTDTKELNEEKNR